MDRGITLRDAAETADVKYSTLSTWERSQAYPPADALMRLASAYDVDVGALLGYPARWMGVLRVDTWPPGLLEFVNSEMASELELRPWEVGVLAGLVGAEQMDPRLGNWATLLVRWRVEHEDTRGL